MNKKESLQLIYEEKNTNQILLSTKFCEKGKIE